jgi:hypothetical protein
MTATLDAGRDVAFEANPTGAPPGRDGEYRGGELPSPRGKNRLNPIAGATLPGGAGQVTPSRGAVYLLPLTTTRGLVMLACRKRARR